MKTILIQILNLVQPLSVWIFLVAGILSLIVGQIRQGIVDLAIAFANFMIFYGHIFIKN